MVSIEAQMGEAGSLLQVVAELNRAVSGRISVCSIDFEQGRSLLLQGNCFSLPQTTRLVEALQLSSHFSKVELRSSDVQRTQDRDEVHFTVVCQLRPSARDATAAVSHANI
jgi:hypothetical protein